MNPEQSYHDEILRVFREAGEPIPTRVLAHRCVEAGVFPSDWLESAAIRAVQNVCREALKTSDIHGLPFAGRTTMSDDDGSPLWAQRELWDYETYAINIAEHEGQARANIKKARLLADECREKFGRSPSVPIITGGASEGAAD